MEKRDSKLVRMLVNKPNLLCPTGKALVRRRYQGKSLQQAWRSASVEHLKILLEGFSVPAPVKCGLCTPSCYWAMNKLTAKKFRACFKGIPAKVLRAYAVA